MFALILVLPLPALLLVPAAAPITASQTQAWAAQLLAPITPIGLAPPPTSASSAKPAKVTRLAAKDLPSLALLPALAFPILALPPPETATLPLPTLSAATTISALILTFAPTASVPAQPKIAMTAKTILLIFAATPAAWLPARVLIPQAGLFPADD